MGGFNNLLKRESSSPKNEALSCVFGSSDSAAVDDGLYRSTAADRAPVFDMHLGDETTGLLTLFKRETSSPKNGVFAFLSGDGNQGINVCEMFAQESGLHGLAHMKSDLRGNSISDQRHRGGISG